MTGAGLWAVACGGALVGAPLFACYQKHGSLSDEAWTTWLVNQPFELWAKLQLMVWCGMMLLSFGLLI